ncbi:MAG: M3 family oligoendopeptidase [Bacteroidetes bacterium]|nr:MAG: M3 family oligoendopeptidase [Bacteroidota bacterium]
MRVNEIQIPSGKIQSWEQIKSVFEQLFQAEINDTVAFELWLEKLSDIESYISEDLAWRYIRMTCDTNNQDLEADYLNFVSEIQPHIAPWEDKLNHKLNNSPFKGEFQDAAYGIYFKKVSRSIELYREENIPLFVELQTDSQKYGSISGAMTVELDGNELTLQQAAKFLKNPDRAVRQNAFEKIQERRLADKDTLDELLNKLIKTRNKVARNAGFNNFRDYMHESLGRFDYSIEDCFKFHDAVESAVVPFAKKLSEERLAALGYDTLKPWDGDVDLSGKAALHPFSEGKELAAKTITAFDRLDPFFGDVIRTMQSKGQLDLDSRKGKAPGGYNYPLAVTGYPFIFMNAAGTQRDLETMVHEGGHAIHSVLTKDLKLQAFKDFPSEVAELASMSMELISMDVWDEFYPNPEDLNRAKAEQLEGVLKTLPWIATVDAFQHWLYTNEHTEAQRLEAWENISSRFSSGLTDWTGHETAKLYTWQKQLHIYEVPFYYIEYGFAQLGAIAVWKNYMENKAKGLQQYKDALSLGYTQAIPEIYKTSGARFDFSNAYVQELMDFVYSEYQKVKA